MIETMKEQDRYLADFESSKLQRSSVEPQWLTTSRNDAMEEFAAKRFPTLQEEAWRFTNLSALSRKKFIQPETPGAIESEALASLSFADLGVPRLVFVDGFYSEELSNPEALPSQVRIVPLSRMIQSDPDWVKLHLGECIEERDHPFALLNAAFFKDGVCLDVPRGVVLETPVHFLFLNSGAEPARRIHLRNLLVIGESAQLTIVETYLGIGDGEHFSNPVTEVEVGDNATVLHYRLQNESQQGSHIGLHEVHQGRDTNYRTLVIDLGSELVRNDLSCVLKGEGGLAGLNGIYLLNGRQHVDNYTTLIHAVPHCDSRELFKGILDDKSRGIFRGRIIVRKDAQKTDSKQTNQNLLLSDDALVNTKPQLEIYADDVKCTHGATIGQLDDTALFYMRSRGIPHRAARSLLVYAFASEVIDQVTVQPLRDQLVDYLTNWLPKGDLVREVYEG